MKGKDVFIFQVFSGVSREKDALTSWHHLSCASIRKVTTKDTRLPSWNTSCDNLSPCSGIQFSIVHTSFKVNPSLLINLGQKSWSHFWFLFLSNPSSCIHEQALLSKHIWNLSIFHHLPSHHPVQATILFHPRYFKCLLHSLPVSPLGLPYSLFSPATVILCKYKSNHFTSLVKTLQWLPPQSKHQTPITMTSLALQNQPHYFSHLISRPTSSVFLIHIKYSATSETLRLLFPLPNTSYLPLNIWNTYFFKI